MGMAAIGIVYVMKYSPNYFNRDRFVLSNGNPPIFFFSNYCSILAEWAYQNYARSCLPLAIPFHAPRWCEKHDISRAIVSC